MNKVFKLDQNASFRKVCGGNVKFELESWVMCRPGDIVIVLESLELTNEMAENHNNPLASATSENRWLARAAGRLNLTSDRVHVERIWNTARTELKTTGKVPGWLCLVSGPALIWVSHFDMEILQRMAM